MKALLVALLALTPTLASAQIAYDPTRVEFTTSADHYTTIVTSYRLEFFPEGATTPSHTVDLGKPTPDANLTITVPFSSMALAPLTPGVVYVGYVYAVGPGGEARSAPSNTFSSSDASAPPNPLGTIRLVVSFGGLAASYWNNLDFSGTPALQRVDAGVNFNWGTGGPGAPVAVDNFAARWTGFVTFPSTEPFTVCVVSDDGTRLWVNGQQVIDFWSDHSAAERCATLAPLPAGQKIAIRLDYYERGGDATVQLLWSSASTPKAIIPAARLAVQ